MKVQLDKLSATTASAIRKLEGDKALVETLARVNSTDTYTLLTVTNAINPEVLRTNLAILANQTELTSEELLVLIYVAGSMNTEVFTNRQHLFEEAVMRTRRRLREPREDVAGLTDEMKAALERLE